MDGRYEISVPPVSTTGPFVVNIFLKIVFENLFSWTFISMVIASTAVAFVAGSFGAWGPKLITLGLTAYYQSENSSESADLDT